MLILEEKLLSNNWTAENVYIEETNVSQARPKESREVQNTLTQDSNLCQMTYSIL